MLDDGITNFAERELLLYRHCERSEAICSIREIG